MSQEQTVELKKKRKYPKNRAGINDFKTAEFFSNGKDSFQISYLEMAKIQGIQERGAKRRVQSDIRNGYIVKERTIYIPGTQIPGVNIYRLTEKGRKKLGRNKGGGSKTPQKENSSKEEFAKSLAAENFSSKKLSQQEKALFQQYGFSALLKKAPTWWFANKTLLEKTLKLLKQKQSKGYIPHNPLRWISAILKQEGIGYREKVAKETNKKLNNTLPFQTPFEENVLKALQSLQSKGLDTSHASLKILLRKGLQKLSQALSVLQKYLEWKKPIKSLNGMLSWLVGQKEPLELLKPISKSPAKQISKIKNFLSQNASHFTFNKPSSSTHSHEKIHIELFIHQKALLSSVIKFYKKFGSEWRCLTLEMGKTTGNFFEAFSKTLHRHFDIGVCS